MSAVVVDWLGRGGIAQTTRAWVEQLEAAGHSTTVVTRRDRELTGSHVLSPPEGAHALITHRRVAALAARTVRERDPDIVVVQNYVVPPLERALDRAMSSCRGRSIVVMHDHRLHSHTAGTRVGLRQRLRAADSVVVHSHYVGEAVQAFSNATAGTIVIPLPIGPRVDGVRPASATSPKNADGIETAVSFGVMHRTYKGADIVCDLAAAGVDHWRFTIAGVGAPSDAPGVRAVTGYVPATELDAIIADATAAILPYRMATQSAAVALAQGLGTIPIATAVGGIPEQITSGVDGLLLGCGAGIAEWRAGLDVVRCDQKSMAAAARARAERAALQFGAAVHALA